MPPTVLLHNPCSVGTVLTVMYSNDLEMFTELSEWLEAPNEVRVGSDAAMWEVLDDLGYEVGYQSLGRHRRKTCSCKTTTEE